MRALLRLALLAIPLCLALPATAGAQDDCTNYSCAAYAEHDLDNYHRARGRQIGESTSPAYHQAFAPACVDSQSRALGQQVADLPQGRVHGGVGQATCWWSVGDAPAYFDVEPQRFHFLSRTGAKLQGHLWGAEEGANKPGVVITTGSIQASDQMYWWAARALAQAGYLVMTFDVQGQGQSETTGHAPGDVFPSPEGVPSQQSANFHDGTIDALRYFLSTPKKPYRPGTWTADDAKAAATTEGVSWVNPAHGVLDRERLGIAGHSLGASAVSAVQQCSDAKKLWKQLELCTGRSFPIKTVLAWDALSGDGVTPVVPAMSQQADGYFLSPTFAPQAPDPAESLGGFELWRKAGLDVFTYVVRGGTHIEWSQVPYTPATTYGAPMNAYYSVAWMNRWVPRDPAVRSAGLRALLDGPRSAPENPWSANHFSTRRLSAMSLGKSPAMRAGDVRKWAGRSAVGDFAGSNADREGRVIP